MDKELILRLSKTFEESAHEQDGVEYWMARELQDLLGYFRWENFAQTVERAKQSCFTAHQPLENHFREVTKMVPIGSGGERPIDDIMLTRYACYLIAQNGDPRKEEIAFAQSYFALQTRKQELLEERIALNERLIARKKLVETETELSKTIYERGVDSQGFGRIRSKGDQALFGGRNTHEMKRKLGVPESRPLADFLPTITIKAKDFATELTNYNTKHKNLNGENAITREHVNNNRDVRAVLGKSDIVPENLPPAEDIKKLERRVNVNAKKLAGDVKRLPPKPDNEKNKKRQ
ncbi:MAG: DNA damage-inducible protein D [Elusimicrobiales bacterium]|nr:DNA damage-inducible protein D [Elusimicrobiales bacterium]